MGSDRGRRVALLRGINVGGAHKLPMKELAPLFEAAGCLGVRTYIQSGNVVYEGGGADAAGVVRAAIAERYGWDIPIVTRSAEEWDAAIAAMPFDVTADEPRFFAVGFMDREPDAERVAALDPDRSPPDRFEVRGGEVFLHYPGGSARSRLTIDWLERQLGVRCTMRNWNTLLRLQQLCRA